MASGGSVGHGSVGGLSSKGRWRCKFLRASTCFTQDIVGSCVSRPCGLPSAQYIAVFRACHGALVRHVAVVARRRRCWPCGGSLGFRTGVWA